MPISDGWVARSIARRGATCLVAVAVATLALSACAADSGTAATITISSSSGTGSAGPPAPSSSATSWTSSGIVTYEPADNPREAASPDPAFDYGFFVQITSDGFHPKTLVSGCCKAVTWKNLTSRPESVVFDHQLVNSGTIPPGGSWVWTPQNPQSITYHSSLDAFTGALQVNQMFDS